MRRAIRDALRAWLFWLVVFALAYGAVFCLPRLIDAIAASLPG